MSKMRCGTGFVFMAAIGLGWLTASARAGSLDDPAAPTSAASALYTLQDIYNRLDTGVAGAKRAGPFADPASGPVAGAITLDDILAKAPATNANAAAAADVLAGKAYWGLKAGAWGNATGALPARAFSAGSSAVSAGYYAATNLTQADPDLAAGNIKAGATIFGVAGNSNVVDTTTGDAAAGDIVAGKKGYVAGAEVTGSIAVKTLSPTTAVMAAGYYAATNLAQVDPDLASNNILAGAALFGITGSPAVVDTSLGGADAAAGDILAGKVGWVGGSALTGTIAAMTLSPTTTVVPAGYYPATNLSQVDPDLAAGNIKKDAVIFATTGTKEGTVLVYTYTNGLPKTGQSVSYLLGDDGWNSTNNGTAWPNPRFTVQANTNVVLDNFTGLMWARNANLNSTNMVTTQLTFCNDLDYGGYTDWRMPNIHELRSLLCYSYSSPCLCNTAGSGQLLEDDPFSNVQLGQYYFSSTATTPYGSYGYILVVSMASGNVVDLRLLASNQSFVWPVRGGSQ